MIARNILTACLFVLVAAGPVGAGPAVAETDTADTARAVAPRETVQGTVTVTYFHGDRRCTTCRKLEAYSQEAVAQAFADRLADSSLVWQTVNYDRAENKHYIEDYGLYTKSLVLARVVDGEEVEWKNLDRIWALVGNKEDFLAYVRAELKLFLDPPGEQDG